MYAECGENYLNIDLSKGVVFHTTPTLLSSDFEHRIIPFNMLKQKKGNWRELQKWFEDKLGWRISFNDKTPIDTDKEIDLINKFKKSLFHPKIAERKSKEDNENDE